MVKEAEDDANQQEQLDQLTSFMARTTLLDQISGPSTIEGGRLWGNSFCESENLPLSPGCNPSSPSRNQQPKNRPISASSNTPADTSDTSSRSRVADLLSCLSQLETEIRAFALEAGSKLDHVHRPSSKGPPKPFPLQNLIQKSAKFQDRLDVITFKGVDVVLRKNSITAELHHVVRCLEEAQTMWDARLSKIARIKAPSHGVLYDAGSERPPL